MITIEQKQDFKAWYKIWCETCPKTIDMADTNKNQVGEEAITLLLATASKHERLHPKHNIYVKIYEKQK